MKKIILLVLVLLIIFLIYFNFKRENCECKLCQCNPKNTKNIIYGEIIKIEYNRIFIKTVEEQDWIIKHNLKDELKLGQSIKVEHTGVIDQSNPPIVYAVCIELIK